MFSWAMSLNVVKLLNTLPSKKDCRSQNMWYTSPLHIFTITMKSQTKTYFSYANLIKKCTTFNIGIIAFKPNKVSTLVNKDKLELTKGTMGASKAIFMRRMWYLNKAHLTRLIIEIHKILLPLISIIFTSLINSKCFLGLWLK
jgi:hypothetical protein